MEELLFRQTHKSIEAEKWEDWNGRFQNALNMAQRTIDERIKRFDKIVSINEDFKCVSTDCSRAIIDEMFIPESERTIRPAVLNGLAGGVKFIMRGILFKVANGSIGPYEGDDEAAMKTFGNELRNVSHFLCASLNVEHKINIHVALQGIVEYKGFRILAQAKLPINEDSNEESSLRIGTATGRLEDLRISNTDKDLIQTWQEIGKALHLAPHICGDRVLYTCADLEIHQTGTTYYALDFARLFPPQSYNATTHLHTLKFAPGECVVSRATKERYRIVKGIDKENVEVQDYKGKRLRAASSELRSAKHLGSVFFRTFRPEFVKIWSKLSTSSEKSTNLTEMLEKNKRDVVTYGYDVDQDVDFDDKFQKNGAPLSPDAFSGFSIESPDRQVQNARVHAATLYLLEDLIPEFVNDSNVWKNIINGGSSLSVTLHEHGINLRHIGLVRRLHFQMCKEDENLDRIQNLLLFEIVARTLKQMFRMCLRTTACRSRTPSDVPFKNCAKEFFNLVCCSTDTSFWSETLPLHISQRFGPSALRSDERVELRNQVSLNRLIRRLTSDCGVALDLKCVHELTDANSFEFTRGDIKSIEPIFRAMFTTTHAEGQLYSLHAMKRETQQRDPEIVKRLCLNSIKILEKALRRFPSDIDTRTSLSDAHHTLACALQRERCELRLSDVRLHFKRARELRSSDVRCSISNVSFELVTLGIVLSKLRFKSNTGLVNDIVDFGFDGNVVSYDVFKRAKDETMFFIPLAINTEHFKRSENILLGEIRRIYVGKDCTLERILALIGSVLNRLVVDYVQKTCETDDKLEARILRFSRMHHLSLRIMRSVGSKLRDVAEEKVKEFMSGKTTKEYCPNLGVFLWYLLFSSTSWQGSLLFRKILVYESLDRNAFWLLRNPKCNHLAVLESKDDVLMSASRLMDTFEAYKTSTRLIMFQDYFARTIGRRKDTFEADLLDMYDESNGRPTASMWQGLREETHNILNNVHCFRDFLEKIGLGNENHTPLDFAEILRNAIRNAKKKNYLKNKVFEGRDVCRVEESVATDGLTWDNLANICNKYRAVIEKRKKVFRYVVATHRRKIKRAERDKKQKDRKRNK